ncbi:hypothetical protein M378DRAFT_71925 [Amanita muscaria Koide BX008]|uniref:Uncharacterized protein n=1 Tax=Amanita muscaria (strain Koide BX008) TaxID=946122 RepID=A0A0C2XFD9_AMAMK|nr:hypothetical protein M378DRAFT_71925 [Amanita muscaria Koide BX008]
MDSDNDWSTILTDHPIFSLPKLSSEPAAKRRSSLELSSNTLPDFTNVKEDSETPSGRRQVMLLKGADLILAAGKQIRMASLNDARLNQGPAKTYKTLHTPNIQFEIQQIVLNPSGKLLAVAGTYQVAVVVLPRSTFARLVPDTIDCKSVQVGQYYHASEASAPIAKIDWHPWGEAGSTLLVMTIDGKLREYDISIETEEPQQLLSFMPEKKFKSFHAEDPSEREVVSFTLGKGGADWGPLTLYALTRSGDIHAICPYMPKNASVPSSYVHALDCFVSAKREYLAHDTSSSKDLSMLYDYQHKYVSALLKQLPSGTIIPGLSRSVLMHPPTIVKLQPTRQGPFLLQPSPRMLDGSEGGFATDISYLVFGLQQDDPDDGGGEPMYLGAVLVAYQDGRIDVCLDVEKVEAKWEGKQNQGLPMLAVYENVDLGLVSLLKQASDKDLDLLQGNHPLFYSDPIHDDTVYAYHAFGVHSLHLGPVFQDLVSALRVEGDDEISLQEALQNSTCTTVQPILSTYSIERRCSNPVTGVAIPNDVYLTYTIFILTSAMRVTTFPLSLQDESKQKQEESFTTEDFGGNTATAFFTPLDGPAAYMSLLDDESYKPPDVLLRPSGLPSSPRLSLPPSGSKELVLTPETLRFVGTTVANLRAQIHEIQLAYQTAERRVALQQQELIRQVEKCRNLNQLNEHMRQDSLGEIPKRIDSIEDRQKTLLGRLDRTLQALMQKACPELSEHEMKWFDELKRMKEEISRSGRYDGESLVARTRQLEREFSRLIPNLKAIAEKEKRHKEKLAENTRVLGASQAFELGERSSYERGRLHELETDLVRLASQLDLNLERPPTR